MQAIGPYVPVAYAARMWHRVKGEGYSTENQRLFLALRTEATDYRAQLAEGQPRIWTAETVISVAAKTCKVCGRKYLDQRDRGAGFCTRDCFQQHRREWIKQQGVGVVARQDSRDHRRSLQVKALDMISEALALLPDQASRLKVLDFARDMDVDGEETKPATNGHAGEAPDTLSDKLA